MVAYHCSHSYLGGSDQEDQVQDQLGQKLLETMNRSSKACYPSYLGSINRRITV
jgi:hypothetical protein